MSSLQTEIIRVDEAVKEKELQIDKTVNQFKEANARFESLSKLYTSIEDLSITDIPMSEKRKREAAVLKEKSEKYKLQIKEFESSNIEVDQKFHHENLMQLSKELEILRAELQPLEATLRTYKSLPPDINLAKVKIEEAKRELAKLENELQSDIDLLAL